MLPPRLLSLVLLLALTACGDNGTGTDSAGTTGTSNTTGTTDSPDPTGSTGSTGSTGTDSGSGSTATPTTGAACVDPSDTDIGPAVEITIRNDGAIPLFFSPVDLCDPFQPFQVIDADDSGIIKTFVRNCEFTCDIVLQGDCGCGLGCATGPALKIDPGGVHVATWSGTQYLSTSVPDACAGNCEQGCFARANTLAGTYTVRTTFHETIIECGMCDCQAGPDGTCEVDGIASGQAFTAEATLDYPNQTAVEIVFGP